MLEILFALLAGQETARPPEPPLPPVKDSRSPGLTLGFAGGDTRVVRLAALSVPAGTAPSAFVAPGPFKALLDGYVSVDLGTEVVFSAEGTGTLTLLIEGRPAIEAKGPDLAQGRSSPVRLKKGRNKFQALYEPPPQGDARLRIFWTSDEFQREPVHPLALSHDASSGRAGARLRAGRELVAQRRCLKCHASPAAGGMPELGMDAPSLENAGARLNAAWMAAWIRDPRSLRPEATMPAVHAEADAADLAAWLATLGKAAADPPADEAAAKSGGHLFATMRCIGCHTLPEKDPEPDRVPLRHVRAKWKPAALAAFLKKPDAHYAWIEMPVFGLKDEEAAQLAAFLGSISRELENAPVPAGDPAKGKARFEALGCAACHKAPATNALKGPDFAAIPAAGWSRGCLAEKSAKAPDFGFVPAAREALAAFASTDLSALTRDAAPEFFERQFKALRCTACHKRDDVSDAWSDVQDEAKALLPPKKAEDGEFQEVEVVVPHTPSLTWAGERLKPEWTAAFFAGTAKERPRPYLGAIRMPAFPARAQGLALGMALGHGIAPTSPPEAAPDKAMSEIGRKLSGPGGGLDCLSCHAIGPKAATKVFEAPAPNFKLSRERIRYEWFVRWAREPLRVEPGTKMPQFFQQGRSQLVEVLEGDAVKQIDALWHYLLEGEAIRPPGE